MSIAAFVDNPLSDQEERFYIPIATEDFWLFWIYGDKHRFSVLKSLLSKGSRNPVHKFWYQCYTYPSLNPEEPNFLLILDVSLSAAKLELDLGFCCWN